MMGAEMWERTEEVEDVEAERRKVVRREAREKLRE